MAGNSYLLDTVIVVGYFNHDTVIREKLSGITTYVPSIVIGELFFGAYKSQKVESNVKQIREFVEINTILEPDEETADHYGQIKYKLGVKGRPIPENDIWIAAIAMQHKLILVSRDAHFQNVDGLQLEAW